MTKPGKDVVIALVIFLALLLALAAVSYIGYDNWTTDP
jgi:hypothetical protein